VNKSSSEHGFCLVCFSDGLCEREEAVLAQPSDDRALTVHAAHEEHWVRVSSESVFAVGAACIFKLSGRTSVNEITSLRLLGWSSVFLTDEMGFNVAELVFPFSILTPYCSTVFISSAKTSVVRLSVLPIGVDQFIVDSVSPSPAFLRHDVVSTDPGGPEACAGGLMGEQILSFRFDGGEGSSPVLAGDFGCVPGALGLELLIFNGRVGGEGHVSSGCRNEIFSS
jgi:hypothetical protein